MYPIFGQPAAIDQTKLILAKDQFLAKHEINSVLGKVDEIKDITDPSSLIQQTIDWVTMVNNSISNCFVSNLKSNEYMKTILELALTLTSIDDNYSAWRLDFSQRRQNQMVEMSKNALPVIDTIVSIVNAMKEQVGISEEAVFQLQAAPNTYPKPTESLTADTVKSSNIFIVHGHDNEMKESVARFIERIGFKAVILHERSSGGRTIIEKIEVNAEKTDFAIVILSPDDVGYSKYDGIDCKKERARQNVVFEYGYFVGKIGRSNVVALYRESDDFELPSDLQGIIYTPFDARGYWKTEIANELIHAGFNVDKNRI